MASSSSSSSGSWNHDVFLSFRGTDTRKTFVDHLYYALKQQGIHTYKDDEALPRGEVISPTLLKAIKESQIVVIVFSENYADSSWCLDELAYIMKCKDKRGIIVMPIFYHIDPSQVRKQKGKYGEALAKHDSDNKKVKSWRKALMDAGNLSGWETEHIANGHESRCIKEIVNTISNRLSVAISSDDEDLVGMGTHLQDLKTKLEIGSNGDVLMVGIWGVGGGGKTTLASSIYYEISDKFDGCCFVENIREESSKYGLPKLQQKLVSLVLKQEQMEVNRVEEGRILIKRRLCSKKVLLVLDDVNHLDQLKALAGSHFWFGEGSRIIITTRDSHLLHAHKVNAICNISLLDDDEAIKLFRKHCRPIKDHEKLLKDVISYAGGLPLALKVLGSFLCDKDTNEWMSALARLKIIPDMDIIEKLKISYDGLTPMEKELFLDIACFYRGEKKDRTMMMLDACGFHSIIGVKVLMQKALINVSSQGLFDMHDLLQEMGHYIVREENKNLENRSRIWQGEDVLSICTMNATLKENDRIEALQLGWHKNKNPHVLPHVVAKMKELRLMSCFEHPPIPFPREFQPMKLCCLTMESSFQDQLWEGDKHLPNLKVLDLRYSRKLISTPNLDGLPRLERLILENCRKLKEIHPSLGYHKRLMFLDMRRCISLEIFPPIVQMKKLEILLLSHCSKLCKFPEIRINMAKLEELRLDGSGIEIVPSSVGQYCTSLLSLDLRECNRLLSIEGNFHRLKHLKRLYLTGCEQLKILREDLFDAECCLQVLSLPSKSFKNKSMSSKLWEDQFAMNVKFLGFLRCLRTLSLTWCNLADENISFVLCELSNLQVLDLSQNNFSRLHSNFSQLSCLKFLNLSWCKSLVELPDLPSSIAILEARGCDSLEFVDLPTNCKWLWKFSFSSHTKWSGSERVLQSMLQGHAIEDYFISLKFFITYISTRDSKYGTFMLQLPWNWCDEFSGFLIYIYAEYSGHHVIIIKDIVMGMDYEDDDLEVFNEMYSMCYISFGSLRYTSWWNSRHDMISFFIKDFHFKVELVPKKSKGNVIMGTPKDATNCLEFWDEENRHEKTFEIHHDSESCIEILWIHDHESDMFNNN